MKFKKEQGKIKRQLTASDNAQVTSRIRWQDLETSLEQALAIAAQCDRIYADGTSAVRRLFNQGLFTKIYVDVEQDSSGDFTPAFAVLLNTDVHGQLRSPGS